MFGFETFPMTSHATFDHSVPKFGQAEPQSRREHAWKIYARSSLPRRHLFTCDNTAGNVRKLSAITSLHARASHHINGSYYWKQRGKLTLILFSIELDSVFMACYHVRLIAASRRSPVAKCIRRFMRAFVAFGSFEAWKISRRIKPQYYYYKHTEKI